VDRAFHISIAWSFAIPDSSLRRVTQEVFNNATITTTTAVLKNNNNNNDKDAINSIHQNSKETNATTTSTIKEAVTAMRVRVDGVKAKIGNVVTHIPLPDARRRRSRLLNGGVGGLIGGERAVGEEGEEKGGKGGKGGLFGII
jgi:hypothetical protein